MARIRSIKPEYWKSESIAALSMQTRLTFIALWSYVDDNGVGRDVEKLIAAELYPLEDDPRATLAHVSESLDELAEHSRIIRYTSRGKPWLYISNWSEHQKIDHPNKARYPLPSEADDPLTSTNADSPEDVAQPSRMSRATLSPGAVDQGAVDQWSSGAVEAPSATLAKDDPTSALLIEHIRSYDVEPPPAAFQSVRVEIARLVAQHVPEAHIRAGLTILRERSHLHPKLLPQLVTEATNPPKTRNAANRNGEILDAAMARAQAAEARTNQQKAVGQ